MAARSSGAHGGTVPINAEVHFIPGVWEKRDFLAHYVELTGNEVDEERLRFWEVHVMLYVVGIVMTAAKSSHQPASVRLHKLNN